jgi:serine protease Do
LISRVEPGEAGAKAGIKQGDVVVKVNNRDVTPDQTLSFLVGGLAVGARVPIEVIRDGKRQTVTAVLGERPSEERLASIGSGEPGMEPEDEKVSANAAREQLGLAVQALTPEISRQLGLSSPVKGVVVGAVDPSSDAGAKGLQRGDVILSVNDQPTIRPEDLNAAAAAAKKAGRTNVRLFLQRGNTPARYIAIKFRQS